MDEETIMRAPNSLTIAIFILCSGLWITGLPVAHSASCPPDGTVAGIQISHYWESTQGDPFYTQTVEYEGTVGILFSYFFGKFYIDIAGNDTVYKTIKAEQEIAPYVNCTYETANVQVTVEVSSNTSTCTDGILDMTIIETNEATSADYHCVACSSGGCTEYGGTNNYPATRLEHHVRLEYVPGAMDVQTVPQGVGEYSWRLLFRETLPTGQDSGGIFYSPALLLLLSK